MGRLAYTPFEMQMERAHMLSNVDHGLAHGIVNSGLLDGVIQDDQDAMRQKVIPSVKLKPSQTTMVLSDVVGIALEMLNDGTGFGDDLGAIVSADGYIMDGHHRWAGSILARGSDASVMVWVSNLTGPQLLRVLNVVSKGAFGVTQGNMGTGSLSDINLAKVYTQLEHFRNKGRSSKYFSFTPDGFDQMMADNFGDVELGMRILAERAILIPKDVPSWAPQREEMPVISPRQTPGLARLLNKGEVDWNYPFADARRVLAKYFGKRAF